LRAFIPNRFYGWWLAVLSGALVLYNVIALGFFIIPFYRA
jgi:hypothetical protein